MENNLVTLKMYEDYFKAVNDKQFLIANGIDCYIANEYTIQNYWLIKQAVGGIKLQVFEKDKELALEFLQEKNSETLSEELKVEYQIENPEFPDIICPKCGSNHIYRDEKLNGTFGLSILLLGFPLKVKNKTFHCYFCDNEWKE